MNPLSLLSPGRWLLYGALAGALVLGYFAWADHIGDVREATVVARYASQAKATDDKREAVTAVIAPKAEAAQVKIRTVFKTIIKEVPVYVKATDCPMPGGFRVLHDAAANVEVPNPAAVPDAAAVEAQTVAAVVAENYGICAQNAQQLTDLQGWIRAHQAIATSIQEAK